jgi:hypothetical protein
VYWLNSYEWNCVAGLTVESAAFTGCPLFFTLVITRYDTDCHDHLDDLDNDSDRDDPTRV